LISLYMTSGVKLKWDTIKDSDINKEGYVHFKELTRDLGAI